MPINSPTILHNYGQRLTHACSCQVSTDAMKWLRVLLGRKPKPGILCSLRCPGFSLLPSPGSERWTPVVELLFILSDGGIAVVDEFLSMDSVRWAGVCGVRNAVGVDWDECCVDRCVSDIRLVGVFPGEEAREGS